MEYQQLFKVFNAISPVAPEAWSIFQPLLETIDLKRNEYLINEGSRVSHCYMLTDGVIRVFFNKEGNEYNKTFFIPGMFPTPLTALLSDSPTALSFQALLPSRLIRFSYQKFRKLFEDHRCFEKILLRILEKEWINKERHDIRMVTNDAMTNYKIFREEYPKLENQIPQYHIASYLGITPIQLSRIRAQLARSG